ncbi:hypothetical protein FIBSPDRAFT_973360 [Athelia psychrophila]|uniref:Uncharacterized protein n=1 Tax=Athelia psychrophila TaxID=1759441 RepID=A0A167T2S2_9AGAM|nr:hypothetical protein FIBSPDRAFT_973360 [Fibularhizoctonia sp. CBS 109695]
MHHFFCPAHKMPILAIASTLHPCAAEAYEKLSVAHTKVALGLAAKASEYQTPNLTTESETKATHRLALPTKISSTCDCKIWWFVSVSDHITIVSSFHNIDFHPPLLPLRPPSDTFDMSDSTIVLSFNMIQAIHCIWTTLWVYLVCLGSWDCWLLGLAPWSGFSVWLLGVLWSTIWVFGFGCLDALLAYICL